MNLDRILNIPNDSCLTSLDILERELIKLRGYILENEGRVQSLRPGIDLKIDSLATQTKELRSSIKRKLQTPIQINTAQKVDRAGPSNKKRRVVSEEEEETESNYGRVEKRSNTVIIEGEGENKEATPTIIHPVNRLVGQVSCDGEVQQIIRTPHKSLLVLTVKTSFSCIDEVLGDKVHHRWHRSGIIAEKMAYCYPYLVITYKNDLKITVLNINNFEIVKEYDFFNSLIRSVLIQNNIIYTGHQDGSMITIDIETDEHAKDTGHNHATTALARNDRYMISGSSDKSIFLYENTSLKPTKLARMQYTVSSLALNESMAFAAARQKLQIYNLSKIGTGQLLVKEMIFDENIVEILPVNGGCYVATQAKLVFLDSTYKATLVYILSQGKITRLTNTDSGILLGTTSGKILSFDVQTNN